MKIYRKSASIQLTASIQNKIYHTANEKHLKELIVSIMASRKVFVFIKRNALNAQKITQTPTAHIRYKLRTLNAKAKQNQLQRLYL